MQPAVLTAPPWTVTFHHMRNHGASFWGTGVLKIWSHDLSTTRCYRKSFVTCDFRYLRFRVAMTYELPSPMHNFMPVDGASIAAIETVERGRRNTEIVVKSCELLLFSIYVPMCLPYILYVYPGCCVFFWHSFALSRLPCYLFEFLFVWISARKPDIAATLK